VKVANIYIHGTIGSYVDPKGQEVKVVELLDVIQQIKANPADVYLVNIKSPGGLVDTGDQIYDYLESLKATSKVNTITGGDVGSIATKIFLAGEERTIVEGHEFFIHNPWTQPQPGDSNKIALELQSLKQTEDKLRGFYQLKTGITAEGLGALMDNETGMNADQAVTLGFATKKVGATKIKALAFNSNNMSKEKLTVGQKFASKIGDILDQVLGASQVKALQLTTDKGTISVSSEDPNNLTGADATITDASGNAAPAPDGEYKLEDGRIAVVAGGKVTEVKAAAAASAATPSANEAALQAKISALEKELATVKASATPTPTPAPTVNVEEKIAAAITELKNELNVGTRPVKAINNNGGSGKGTELSPIQLAMRKQQAN
jgi:ATP-dependent protease ClpP protease subunit